MKYINAKKRLINKKYKILNDDNDYLIGYKIDDRNGFAEIGKLSIDADIDIQYLSLSKDELEEILRSFSRR